MNTRERDQLIEASVTSHRARDAAGRILAPPEWWDLPPDALDELYQLQLLTRELERLIDGEGMTGTMRAVRARILG